MTLMRRSHLSMVMAIIALISVLVLGAFSQANGKPMLIHGNCTKEPDHIHNVMYCGQGTCDGQCNAYGNATDGFCTCTPVPW
jgi:hypothetical protein